MEDDPPGSSSWVPDDSALAVEQYLQTASCALCQKSFSSTCRVHNEFEQSRVCGDCKFLLHEDFNFPVTAYHRRHGGRLRFSSSESVESILSQQYAQMTNTLRENQRNTSQQEFQSVQSVNDNAADRLQQSASSHTTPSESRRWRWVLSDTESECLENFAFHFGDSESNASLGRYRLSHNESDSFSFSAYGGDSDASVDAHSMTDSRIFTFPGENTEIDSDSDTDIDPMHAGVSIWDLDDEEIEEEEQQQEDMDNQRGRELTEAEGEDAGNQFQNFLSSNLNETLARRQLHSLDSVNLIRPSIRDSWETFSANVFTNLEELDLHLYGGNSIGHLNSRGFEILLENFVENGISREGAPPTSVSFIDSLPCISITEEQEKTERLACAICKDVLAAGTEVNQLPCFHLYHPSCILPWLCSRNSCPLCRYELPTDDKEYEEGKNLDSRLAVQEIVQNVIDDSLSDVSDSDRVGEDEVHEFDPGRDHQGQTLTVDPDINSTNLSTRGRWFFLAAAPVVSLVGIAFVLWFGNPLIGRRMPTAGRPSCEQNRQAMSSVSSNARGE